MLAKSSLESETKPAGSHMSEQQLASYLQDLRTGRAARLNGSRPAPPSKYASKRPGASIQKDDNGSGNDRSTAASPFPASNSSLAQRSSLDATMLNDDSREDPLVPRPLSFKSKAIPEIANPLSRSSSIAYMESGVRWKERQEAHSLRIALEDMDIHEEERIRAAAQDEASSLVLEHQQGGLTKKPNLPYHNPDAPLLDHKAQLQKGSYPGATSQGSTNDKHMRSSSTRKSPALIPDLSEDDNQVSQVNTLTSTTSPQKGTSTEIRQDTEQGEKPRKVKSYHGLAKAVARDVANARRRISSGGNRKPSGERGHFMSPEDKIWEEGQHCQGQNVKGQPIIDAAIPEEAKSVEPEIPRHVRRNPFARVRFQQEKLERTNSAPVPTAKRFNPIEVQKNPPTQSRKPWYLSNKPATPSPKKVDPPEEPEEEDEGAPTMKDGKEIRSDDIRAATSMKRKDRSPHLPQPTAVSDKPGRPIVSFQPGWKPQENESDQVELFDMMEPVKNQPRASPQSDRRATGSTLRQNVASRDSLRGSASPSTARFAMGPLPSVAIPDEMPAIPIINLPDDGDSPSRVLPEEPEIPSIFISETPTREKAGFDFPAVAVNNVPVKQTPSSRPLPRPLPEPSSKTSPHRPHPHHAATAPVPGLAKPHYTPSVRRNSALCAHCALPIAGRILSAAGERYHPECFKCHECGTNLECVAFFPEPDQKHHERITRIQHRMQGLEVQMHEEMTEEDIQRLEEEDGDESLRFFCHLDFHELFSPRCKSCKTPIEGEVVVACGAEWHVGHFFCAQCGDPFDSNTPFVEKEGYAWCVGCHTNRYSPKCKGCRKPITDVVVNALGKEWHGECFCCIECSGPFEDGRYFLRGDSDDPVCVRCEERRLKA